MCQIACRTVADSVQRFIELEGKHFEHDKYCINHNKPCFDVAILFFSTAVIYFCSLKVNNRRVITFANEMTLQMHDVFWVLHGRQEAFTTEIEILK